VGSDGAHRPEIDPNISYGFQLLVERKEGGNAREIPEVVDDENVPRLFKQ
jgi:hypothetical protein